MEVCTELDSGASGALVKNMVFQEKRLRNNIMTLRTFSTLIAPYEHEIFMQGVICGINSFHMIYSVSFTERFS
jgi:hypothetical protein